MASYPLVRITLSDYVQNIKALIDSSSEVNIMPYRIARQIGIPTSFIDITINTIGGSLDFLTSYASNVKVRVSSIVIPIDFLLSNVEEGGIKNIVILG
jgi:oxalate decarboxylase/phosphoglucose isomerase-like protein (cupin superfamily)